jgi:hypothetical protein
MKMTNLNNERTTTEAARIQPFRGWSMLLGLVLVGTMAASAACSGSAKPQAYDATFTKWVTTSAPAAGVVANMVGVVGGDVGTGTYAGDLLSADTVGNTTSIHAIYHFNGSKHAFTADLKITQDESAGTAALAGQVTDGWLKGAAVTGQYKILAVCPMETPDNAYEKTCFQGTLHLVSAQ